MKTNFLLGRGELLTSPILGPKIKPKKKEAYSFDEATKRLTPQFATTASDLAGLPALACPNDFAVARVTMNPSFLARTFFPEYILRAVGLETIGSRTVSIVPDKWTKTKVPSESTTTELFVAGARLTFQKINSIIPSFTIDSREASDLTHIEQIRAFSPSEKIVSVSEQERYYEVGVHLLPSTNANDVRTPFLKFASSLGIHVHSELTFTAGNLWFVPVEGSSQQLEMLAQFVFVRVIRPLPPLRSIRPYFRNSGVVVNCELPVEQPISSLPRVAILDGGIPESHVIQPWLQTYHKLDESADDDVDSVHHGLAVTSAFLFGPIQPNGTASRPFSYINHLRVFDAKTADEDPLELYRVLGLIEQVLLSRQFEFINLSLGPDLPIEDHDVHSWTSVIDHLLSDGNTLMTIAIGNNGQRDALSGNARVQVPADCVNAVAVGSATSTDSTWQRSSYSALGPGRSPGVVKPDVVGFGGCANNYFHVLAAGNTPNLVPQLGTSLSAPYILRSAVGIRAILGGDLSPMVIKALLVHSADRSNSHRTEVGWGKVPDDVMSLITSPPGVARIVYQGELLPGKYLRAKLPLPVNGLDGNVKITATFCYASPTDPQDLASYTRAGLEVTFRPHMNKTTKGSQNPKSKGFFSSKEYMTEAERRRDTGKWETVLHDSVNMRGSSLQDPVFDIHYNAREAGHRSSGIKIPYALIITVGAPNHADLYADILAAYTNVLVPIQPQVSLPIRL